MKTRRRRFQAAGLLAAGLGALLSLYGPLPVRAGWIVEEFDADFPGESRTYLFQDGRVRVEGLLPGLTVLLDLPAAEGYIIDEKRGAYAGGRVDDIERAFREERKGAAANAAPEESSAGKPGAPVVYPGVRLERSSGGDKVAGFDSEHYRVLLDEEEEEELVEELWLAPGIGALKGENILSFLSGLEVMTGGSTWEREDFPPGYDEHPDYLQILKSGFPVRKTLYLIGERSTVEVRAAVEKDLPESAFSVPAGLRKADYLELFLGKR